MQRIAGVRHPRPVRESSCLGVFSQLPGSFLIGVSHFSDSGPEVLKSRSPWRPPFILPLGHDLSGSAEPALVLYALGTEHLPRCSHMDAILRFVRWSYSSVLNRLFCSGGRVNRGEL